MKKRALALGVLAWSFGKQLEVDLLALAGCCSANFQERHIVTPRMPLAFAHWPANLSKKLERKCVIPERAGLNHFSGMYMQLCMRLLIS